MTAARWRSLEAGVLLLVASIVVAEGVRVMDAREHRFSITAGGYLVLLGVLLTCATIAVWIRSRSSKAEPRLHVESGQGIRGGAIGFALFAAYVLLVGFLGYLLSTALFLALWLRMYGSYRWAPVLAGSLAFSVCTAYLWTALGVLLGRGVIPWP